MLSGSWYVNAITLSNLAALPFDYVKTQMQIRKSFSTNTFFLLFIGFDTVLFKSYIQYNLKRKLLKSTYEGNKLFIIPSFAALTLLLCPFDNILVKLQTRNLVKEPKYFTTIDAFVTIYLKEGIRGLYRGGFANFLKFSSFVGVSEITNIKLYEYYIMIWKYLIGMCAVIPATLASHPFDTIKAHQQYYGSTHTSFIETCSFIYSNKGFFGFYSGLKESLLRNFLVSVFIVSSLEYQSN